MQFNPPFFCEYLSEKKKKQNQKKAWKKKPGEKIGGGVSPTTLVNLSSLILMIETPLGLR